MVASDPRHARGAPVGLVVPSSTRSVRLLRRFAVDACAERGWGRCADTVALLVTEVATNAVLHARGPQIGVRVVDAGARLRVEVDDGSPELPAPRGPRADDEDGRGLVLVEALALRWGFDARPGGKTFWFEIGP